MLGRPKVKRLDTKYHQPITINGQSHEDVVEFVFLGSNISSGGGADQDDELRINKARHASEHCNLSGSLPNSPETQKSEYSIQTIIKSVLLCGCEPRKTTKLNFKCRTVEPMTPKQLDTQIKSRKRGLDRPYTLKGSQKHCKTSPRLQSPRQEEAG